MTFSVDPNTKGKITSEWLPRVGLRATICMEIHVYCMPSFLNLYTSIKHVALPPFCSCPHYVFVSLLKCLSLGRHA